MQKHITTRQNTLVTVKCKGRRTNMQKHPSFCAGVGRAGGREKRVDKLRCGIHPSMARKSQRAMKRSAIYKYAGAVRVAITSADQSRAKRGVCRVKARNDVYGNRNCSEDRGETVLGVTSAESLLALGRLRVGGLVFDETSRLVRAMFIL
jgi:hypothetical protein